MFYLLLEKVVKHEATAQVLIPFMNGNPIGFWSEKEE